MFICIKFSILETLNNAIDSCHKTSTVSDQAAICTNVRQVILDLAQIRRGGNKSRERLREGGPRLREG